MARCLEGDERAWTALVRRYQPLVYAVARSYRLSEEDLGDVFQDVFTALVRGMPRLRDARALCRWLSSTTDRIAFTLALRRRREAARNTAEPIEDRPVADPGEPVGADLEALEERLLVRLALGRIGRRCQELLDALYAEDAQDYRAIGRTLGMPVGSIGPTRARCIQRLRESLESVQRSDSGITRRASSTSIPEDGRTRRKARPHGVTTNRSAP